MPLIMVKSKFQVAIPAELCRGIELREGDIVEATMAGDGILLRPMDEAVRNAAADRIVSSLAATAPSPADAGRTEDEIMEDSIAEIAAFRRKRRRGET